MALIGNTNAEKIWNFCKSKGMNDYGASVVLANMDAESGLNPKNLQDSYEESLGFDDETYTALVDNGVYTKTQFVYDRAGYSLCQWTFWSRKKAMYEFVKAKGKSIGDLETVLEFFYKEISESYYSVLTVLKTATSIQQANNIMVSKYECPENIAEAQKKRETIANTYYARFAVNKNMESGNIMAVKTYQENSKVQLSKNFNSYEFRCGLGRPCSCSTILIDDKLVEYLQKIRDHFGKSITITSAYRCPSYNKSIGSGTGSYHTKGQAADIVVSGVAPREVAKYAESMGVKGIGLYETSADGHFVHIDTRTTKSFWYGQAQAYRSTFGGSTNANNNSSTTSSSTSSGYKTLSSGSRGNAVEELQENLNYLGYSCGTVDGDYGAKTANAVREFQRKNGLSVDGIAGPKTLEAINKKIASSGTKIKVTASLLNVRAGAGTNYKVVTTIKKDSTHKLLEEKNGWGRISSGWISSDYYKKI